MTPLSVFLVLLFTLKCGATLLAHNYLLLSMQVHVILQSGTLTEIFIAYLTFKQLLTGMYVHVLF